MQELEYKVNYKLSEYKMIIIRWLWRTNNDFNSKQDGTQNTKVVMPYMMSQ
jgi:hypothetical protein